MRADRLRTSRPNAFSLIEVLVVLAVLAMMAATVSISLSGMRNQATTDDVIMRLSQFDRSMRTHARRFDEPQNLAIDLDRDRLLITTTQSRNDNKNRPAGSDPVRTLALPNGYGINRVVTASNDIEYGRASIRCSSEGWTSMYALQLTDSTDATFWLVMNGFGGSVEKFEATDANEQSILGVIRED